MPTRTAKKQSTRSEDVTFIGAWIPDELMSSIDNFISAQELDRSKFLRLAVKEKIAKSQAGEVGN